MIRIEGLNKTWSGFRLRDITLKIKDREYFALLGPTGAGKTLLMEVLIGLHRPDSGRIRMGGRTITKLPPEKRDMAMVFQDIYLFPHLNVLKNLTYGASGPSVDEAPEIAKALGIGKLLHRYPYTLSRGEQQRAAIGRALLNKPRLLLLDEPFSALDQVTTRRVSRIIKKAYEKEEMTIVHVSHDQQEVMKVADRIAVLNNGLIEGQGTWKEIFRTPQSEFIARLVGVENLIPGRAKKTTDGSIVKIDGISFKTRSDLKGKVIMAIRADSINISRDPQEGVENLVSGRVKGVFDRGINIEINVSLTNDGSEEMSDGPARPVLKVHISRQTYAGLSLNLDEVVNLWFPRTAVRVFTRTKKKTKNRMN